MINLIKAEFFKLRKSKAFFICMIVTTICAALLLFIAYGNANGMCEVASSEASGLSDIFIMSVVGALMAGIIICNDFENKNIHDEISCGRPAIVVSKTVIFVFVIMMLVLPYAVVGFVGYVSGADYDEMFSFSTFLSMMVNIEKNDVSSGNILKAIIVLLVSLISYASRLSFCIPVAFKVKKSVVVAVIGVVFGFVIDLVLNALKNIPGLDKLIELLPYAFPKLTINDSTGYIAKAFVSSIVFIGLMSVLTYGLFRKDEIK